MKYFIPLFFLALACSPLPPTQSDDDVGTSGISSSGGTSDLSSQEDIPSEKIPPQDDCLCPSGPHAFDGNGEVIGQVVGIDFNTVDILKENYLFSVNLITGHLIQAIHPEVTPSYQKIGIVWEESDCFSGAAFQAQMANGPCEEQGPPSVYQIVGRSDTLDYDGDYWMFTDLLKQSDETYLFQSGWRMVNGECTFFSQDVCVRSLEAAINVPHSFELPISID